MRRARTQQCLQGLMRAQQHIAERKRRQLLAAQATLDALNPHRIVKRGYAIVRKPDGALVKNALDLSAGEQLGVELAAGSLNVQVLNVAPNSFLEGN
jgi:exodeoxyribonuclease VII large subunit